MNDECGDSIRSLANFQQMGFFLIMFIPVNIIPDRLYTFRFAEHSTSVEATVVYQSQVNLPDINFISTQL
jgi:hypothetical protein